MSYDLSFLPSAKKEWDKLGHTIKEQFKKKLEKVLNEPRIEQNKLSGHSNLYKIKLRSSGYRLAYEVINNEMIIYVISVGKRENNSIYKRMNRRLK
ncbi:type II toxin-antitoxin system RelE/ParE family toxin [Lentisphaera profundi]|uniref:Type II toxin-antitoxin system RelE/ParE family toxin n=1 Tax=Lentisphaera profundi TaxID=1658616 RepID=A0ABY7VU46_9BACT|nr:type II toxin-antitoxin system RelE/ParE family toxin [Lentisphaera profundi]WDE97695.1 type II toxin-antitoxin system RelE/ParE family toxin [Lentisphaera profundi]